MKNASPAAMETRTRFERRCYQIEFVTPLPYGVAVGALQFRNPKHH